MNRVWIPIAGIAAAVVLAAGAHLSVATVAAQGGGTITGHVKLTGTPPPNAPIRMGADPNCLKINAGKRVVQDTVLKAADGGLANVFVNVKGTFANAAGGSTAPAVIDQQGCVYHPRVLGARVGQQLQIKNDDATLHNIHSLSTKGNDFNTGQPQAGMVFNFTPKTEEVMLHFKCDVHSWMTGYMGVLTHPYYAVSDAAGSFKITGVPAGKQTIQVWHEAYGPLTQTVDVKAGATATVDFTYTGTEKAGPPAGFAMQEVTLPAQARALAIGPASR
jgi:plastocyanin